MTANGSPDARSPVDEAMLSAGDPLGLVGALVDVGGRTYAVRPPTLREVLGANAALAAAAAGFDDAQDLLRRALAGWLPLSMRSVLLSQAVARADCFACIEECLKAGLASDAAKADAEEAQEEARRLGWNEIIAQYRARYQPHDVLEEPWPFFSRQVAQMARLRALHQTEQATWYAAAKLGGRLLTQLYIDAGLYETPKAPAHLVGEAGEEWAAKKRAERAAYLERRREKMKAQAEARTN